MNKEFWDEFQSLLVSPPKVSIEYRLHYNEAGEIYLGTTHDHPADTQYVVVTKEEYDQYFTYRVVKGQLKTIEHNAQYHVRLKKSDTGYTVVKNHAGLILESNETFNNIEYYARNN